MAANNNAQPAATSNSDVLRRPGEPMTDAELDAAAEALAAAELHGIEPALLVRVARHLKARSPNQRTRTFEAMAERQIGLGAVVRAEGREADVVAGYPRVDNRTGAREQAAADSIATEARPRASFGLLGHSSCRIGTKAT